MWVPQRVLTEMPYEWSDQLLSWVKKTGIPLDFEGKRTMEKIDPRFSVTAEVRWEKWTNGENFEILRLIFD